MKKRILKLLTVALALVLLTVSITSCGIAGFIDDLFGKDVKFKGNAYLHYVDESGASHVIANGKLVDKDFEGDISLVVAADNSFAYIFDETDEGMVVYLLQGEKLSTLCNGEPIDEVIATSTLTPGIVYVKTSGSGSHYMSYTEKDGEVQIVRENKDPDNFCISSDGKTVVFTVAGKNSDERVLCLFTDGYAEQTSVKNAVPVAVSGQGDYIYYSQEVSGIAKLYVYNVDRSESYEVEESSYFRSIVEMNKKGDEVIFTVERPTMQLIDPNEILSGGVIVEESPNENPEVIVSPESNYISGVSSYLYRYKEKKAENRILLLGAGEIRPAGNDPDIAVYASFADTYVCSDTATYYISGKYQKSTILSKYKGKFSPDSKYLYFVNKDSDLVRMELNGDRGTKIIGSEVVDFAITDKGNVYYLSIAEGDSEGNLYFYNPSTNRPESLDYEATVISFYDYADRVYYAVADKTTVRVSKNSSNNEIAKFGSVELTSVPYFTDPTSKVTYAIVYDPNYEAYSVYYTSNGDKFSIVQGTSDCATVIKDGEELDLSEYIVDFID